jgi:hypothetical protein
MGLVDQLSKTKPKTTAHAKTQTDALGPQEQAAYSKLKTPDAAQLARLKVETALRERHIHLDGLIQDQTLRDKYASKAYWFVWVWSAVLFILLFLSGSKSVFGFEFELSETVTVALITGVTVNILGVFLSVMNNLFPKPVAKKNSDNKKPNKTDSLTGD